MSRRARPWEVLREAQGAVAGVELLPSIICGVRSPLVVRGPEDCRIWVRCNGSSAGGTARKSRLVRLRKQVGFFIAWMRVQLSTSETVSHSPYVMGRHVP